MEWVLARGGDGVRTGLEDNIRITKDRLAKSNAELVSLAAEAVARCQTANPELVCKGAFYESGATPKFMVMTITGHTLNTTDDLWFVIMGGTDRFTMSGISNDAECIRLIEDRGDSLDCPADRGCGEVGQAPHAPLRGARPLQDAAPRVRVLG